VAASSRRDCLPLLLQELLDCYDDVVVQFLLPLLLPPWQEVHEESLQSRRLMIDQEFRLIEPRGCLHRELSSEDAYRTRCARIVEQWPPGMIPTTCIAGVASDRCLRSRQPQHSSMVLLGWLCLTIPSTTPALERLLLTRSAPKHSTVLPLASCRDRPALPSSSASIFALGVQSNTC